MSLAKPESASGWNPIRKSYGKTGSPAGRVDGSFASAHTAYAQWADLLRIPGYEIDEIDESIV